VLLGSEDDGKVALVCKVGPEAVAAGANAGGLINEVACVCGGGGGGRPDYAEGAGKDPARLEEALAAAKAALGRQIGGKSS